MAEGEPAAARDTRRLDRAPRCGARTRCGAACQAPVVKGRKRCRMHGGAKGSGAPRGNRNALKHGRTTREAKQERRAVMALIRDVRRTLPGASRGG